MALREEKVRKVLRERILAVRFLPFGDRTVIAAGISWASRSSNFGDFGPSGFADKAVTLDDNVSEASSNFSIEVGKVSGSWDLHEQRINTIDFHPENVNLFATSSTDGTACIWDLRRSKENKLECLKTVQHNRAVHSAHFSPSGSCLATTSRDDKVRIISGANFEDLFMIKHNNQTGRWLSTFRAIWGWDDSYLYLGNMRRAVDVISVADRTTTTLESEHVTSIPCRFAAHPYNVGSLACATAV
ncbi:DNA damage-binding protein CMR1, partial [Ananas comosus]